jgi:hypothetical protein
VVEVTEYREAAARRPLFRYRRGIYHPFRPGPVERWPHQRIRRSGCFCICRNGGQHPLGRVGTAVRHPAYSRITSTGGGYVETTSLLNAPSAVNPGNLGLLLSSGQNLGSTVIRRGHVSQVNGAGRGNSIDRFYDVLPSNNTALGATLRINYFDEELNGLDESTLVLWKSEDQVNWSSQGYTTRDATANYVEKTGIDQLSRWTLSSLNNPLPLQFLSFTAHCTGNTVLLQWTTAQEQNTGRFIMERSLNGTDWSNIGTVAAAGNSTAALSYTYTDANPSNGQALYRIMEVDLDGRQQLTPVAATDCGLTANLKAWPNPVKDLLWLNIETTAPSPVTIKLYDNRGALLQVVERVLSQGSNQLSIAMATYPAGIYHLTATWNSGVDEKTINVLKAE